MPCSLRGSTPLHERPSPRRKEAAALRRLAPCMRRDTGHVTAKRGGERKEKKAGMTAFVAIRDPPEVNNGPEESVPLYGRKASHPVVRRPRRPAEGEGEAAWQPATPGGPSGRRTLPPTTPTSVRTGEPLLFPATTWCSLRSTRFAPPASALPLVWTIHWHWCRPCLVSGRGPGGVWCSFLLWNDLGKYSDGAYKRPLHISGVHWRNVERVFSIRHTAGQAFLS